MKRVLSMICAVVLCLGMAGCGGNKQVGDDPTAVYLDGEKVISLGMTRDEVDAVLELDHTANKILEWKNDKNGSMAYENNIIIKYNDNIVSMIMLTLLEEESKEYTDCLGNSLGMNYNKVKKKIGKKFAKEDNREEKFGIYFDAE